MCDNWVEERSTRLRHFFIKEVDRRNQKVKPPEGFIYIKFLSSYSGGSIVERVEIRRGNSDLSIVYRIHTSTLSQLEEPIDYQILVNRYLDGFDESYRILTSCGRYKYWKFNV